LAEDAFTRIVTLNDLIREVESSAGASAAARPEVSLATMEARWVSPPNPAIRILGALLYGFNWLAMRALFRLRSVGRSQIPVDAQIVLVSNHQSDIDAFALCAALPWRIARRLSWGGEVGRLFHSAARRLIARAMGVFPVDDRAAERSLALARAALARGRSLVWFPEGWRSPDGRLQGFLPGIGHILRDFRGPVVPVQIQGAFAALPRGRRLPRAVPIQVRFGPPVHLNALPAASRADAARLAEALRDSVAALGGSAPQGDARSS
jgi:long-chain acyl-CoA synthetase